MRLIDADDVLRFIEDEIEESKEEKADAQARNDDNDTSYNCGEIQEARRIKKRILESPTIDAEPVVHARWVKDREGNTYCSHCDKYIPAVHFHAEYQDYESEWDEEIEETEVCPNCGAKMDGGADDGNA